MKLIVKIKLLLILLIFFVFLNSCTKKNINTNYILSSNKNEGLFIAFIKNSGDPIVEKLNIEVLLPAGQYEITDPQGHKVKNSEQNIDIKTSYIKDIDKYMAIVPLRSAKYKVLNVNYYFYDIKNNTSNNTLKKTYKNIDKDITITSGKALYFADIDMQIQKDGNKIIINKINYEVNDNNIQIILKRYPNLTSKQIVNIENLQYFSNINNELNKVIKIDKKEEYEQFIKKYQQYPQAKIAKQKLEIIENKIYEKEVKVCQKQNTIAAYQKFLTKWTDKPNKRIVNNLFKLYEKQKNKEELFENFMLENPKLYQSIPEIYRAFLELPFVGPEEITIKIIRDYIKQDLDDSIITAKIRFANKGYKNFSLEEINVLKGWGFSNKIIATMMEYTVDIKEKLEKEKLEKERIAREIKLLEQKQKLVQQEAEQNKKPVATVGGCIKQIAALKACEEIPWPGSLACASLAKANFKCDN